MHYYFSIYSGVKTVRPKVINITESIAKIENRQLNNKKPQMYNSKNTYFLVTNPSLGCSLKLNPSLELIFALNHF